LNLTVEGSRNPSLFIAILNTLFPLAAEYTLEPRGKKEQLSRLST